MQSNGNNGNTIFVGMKINEKLRDELDSCRASMRVYFANNDSKFLQVMYIDSDEHIGKVTASGASIEDLKNMLMNLKSMLNMICPQFTFQDKAIKIFSVTPAPQRNYL